MTDLSPAAQAVWDAFNEDEAGVFVDYGDKLAAAIRVAANWVVPAFMSPPKSRVGSVKLNIRNRLQSIADELEGRDATSI